MIYRANALSLSLLLGAGGVVVSAVSLPCRNWCEAHHKEPHVTSHWKARTSAAYKLRAGFQPNLNRGVRRSIFDSLTSSPDELQDNASGEIDPGTPTPHHTISPVGIDLNDPIGGATGWLNHEERVYSTIGLEGELDLVANSDEKPMGVKIGTLGYTPSGSAHNPFELLPETEAGATVFLTPSELATDQTLESLDPDASFSNHSTPALITRSTSLGAGLLPNLNLTSAGSASASGATELSNLMHVLIKAGSPSNSGPETLCVTFYAHSAQNYTDSDPPMFLERCDNSFLPGGLSSSADSNATQLWQYDPKTHELKPLLQNEPATSSMQSVESQWSPSTTSDMIGAAGETTASQPFSSLVEVTRITVAQPPAATTQRLQGHTSDNATPPSSSEAALPSQVNVRRSDSSRTRTELKGLVAPRYTVVGVVEPYSLVFVPRIAAGPGTTLPDSPV